MPISVNISSRYGNVTARATGQTKTRGYGPIFREFGLDRDEVLEAMQEIDHRFTSFSLYEHTKTCVPDEDSVRVIPRDPEILTVGRQYLKNKTSRTSTCTSSLSERKTNKTSVTWSESNGVTTGWSAGFSCKIEGSYSKSFNTESGEDITNAEEYIVGSDCSMSVPVPPKSEVLATLKVTRRKMRVKVTYDVYVCGDVAGVYGTSRQPLTCKISEVLKRAGKSNKLRITQTIDIDCYTDSRITQADYDGSDSDSD